MHIRPRYVVDSVGVIVLLLLSSNSGNVVVELCLVILISPILLLFRWSNVDHLVVVSFVCRLSSYEIPVKCL